jgi:flagella basal body P-ring formation protein FlgA
MQFFKFFAIVLAVNSVFAAENIGPLELLPQAQVGSDGVYLSNLVTNKNDSAIPRILLASAPQIGRPLFLSRFQVNDLLSKKAPELICSNWLGADKIRITRSSRIVDEPALKALLTAAIQEEQIKTRGELELDFNRSWNNLTVPDDVLSLKIKELPNSGVSANFICRFELLAGSESVGTFQQPLQAKVWKNVFVARSNLVRGQLLKDADIGPERRDILALREFVVQLPLDDPYVEFRENVSAGTPITSRALRLRAIVKRGRVVDAMLQEDSMTISVKAEALEDGVPGQPIRVRNIHSKREFKGKVQDEQTVLVMF